MSGRVVGLAVHPQDINTYYVAVASGGVWKTTNNGTTWAAVFDGQDSYSIGYVALDPTDPETSGSAPARTTRSAASATATACMSARTAGGPGRTSA